MNLDLYLQSAEALDNIRALLGERDNTRYFCPADVPHIAMEIDTAHSWRLIRIDAGPVAYYRQDEGYFTVSDLGDGVKTLRLRTGKVLAGWGNWFNGVVDSTAGVVLKRFVSANELPDAIRNVLLYSHRVANPKEAEKPCAT